MSQINGTIKLLETDYIIKKRNTDTIELEIKNKQFISIFQNYNLLTIELDLDSNKKTTKGIPIIGSIPLFSDYNFSLIVENGILFDNNTLILKLIE